MLAIPGMDIAPRDPIELMAPIPPIAILGSDILPPILAIKAAFDSGPNSCTKKNNKLTNNYIYI